MRSLDVATHLPRLRRYARLVCRNAADADDLVQETLVKAMARAELFRPGRDLSVWLFTILHNVFVSGARAVARRQRLTALGGDAECGRFETTQEVRVELERTLAALEQLPDEQRQIILLVSVEGMTTDEGATVLGLPIGTVRMQLARGRDALRRLSRRRTPGNLRSEWLEGPMSDPIEDEELSAFIDSDLPSRRMAEIEDELERSPALRQKLLELLADHWSLAAMGKTGLEGGNHLPLHLTGLAADLTAELDARSTRGAKRPERLLE